MPVLVDTNLIPTGRTLADGRPIYSTAVNAQTRVNPAFNHTDTFVSPPAKARTTRSRPC